jgi:rod shape-determining protein MreC
VALRGRTRSTKGLVVILVTVSLVTITIDYREGQNGPLARLGEVALTVITPLQKAVNSVTHPIGTFFTGLAHSYSLEEKVRDLLRQLDAAKTEAISIRSLEAQVKELQDLIGMKNTLGLEATGATVIGSGVSNFEWSVTIDKGSSSGIRRGMAVMAAAGLVGTVTEVSPIGSKVTLILDPGMEVSGRLVSSQQIGGLVGQGNGPLRMQFVNQTTQVEVGEPVETAGYNGSLYPAGIRVGEVSSVNSEPASGSQDIEVTPSVDFSSLNVVLVVLSTKSQ